MVYRGPSCLRDMVGCILVLVCALWPGTASADLTGHPSRPPALTVFERQALSRNPDLNVVEAASPWLVRQILTLGASIPNARGNQGPQVPDPGPPGPEQQTLLDRNPALKQYWRTNPIASLTLLNLIKMAGAPPDQ